MFTSRIPKDIEDSLLNLPLTPGSSIPPALRQELEQIFHCDLEGVRVHENPVVGLLRARAFTWGHSIFFAPNEMDWTVASGLQLLGHELAHVIQQRQMQVSNGEIRLLCDPDLEAEADSWGDKVAATVGPLPVRPVLVPFASSNPPGRAIQCASAFHAVTGGISASYGWCKSWFVTTPKPEASKEEFIEQGLKKVEQQSDSKKESVTGKATVQLTPARNLEVPPVDSEARATFYQSKAEQVLAKPPVVSTPAAVPSTRTVPDQEFLGKLATQKDKLAVINSELPDTYATTLFQEIGAELQKTLPDGKVLDTKLRELTKRLMDCEEIQGHFQRDERLSLLKVKLSKIQSRLDATAQPKSYATWAAILMEYSTQARDKSKILKQLYMELGKNLNKEPASKSTFTPVAGYMNVARGANMSRDVYAKLDRTAIGALHAGKGLTSQQFQAYEDAMGKGVIASGSTGASGIKSESGNWVIKLRISDAKAHELDNIVSPMATETVDDVNKVIYLNFNQLTKRH